MRQLRIGEVTTSRIGLGTWQFGSREWGYGKSYAQGAARTIVRRALDLGVTLFDTAEVYGFGASERILGEALAGRRGEAVVASKLMPVLPLAPIVERRARASARRLGVERIDLYQVHQPNPLVPDTVIMTGMRRLLDAGVVGAVGVSNYSLARWQAAERALGRPVVSNQVQYSLVHRAPERELLAWAQANDRTVIAYSPLGQGLLSGRYDETHRPSGGVRALNPLFLPENLERARPLLTTLREVAGAHDVTPAQVALAWLVHQPNVVAIPGASSVEQVESNAAAGTIELADDEVAALSGASDAFAPVTGVQGFARLAKDRFPV